jgi:UDP-2-acetamido-3-amino-2,3-dideoxy-glucuronate N-acetyltransferase
MQPYVHPTAIIEDDVTMEEDVKVWHFCHVRKNAILRKNVSLARDVFVDLGVEIGSGTRVQNGVSIYHGVKIKSWCFVGPHVIFTNDMYPRAGNKNWHVIETVLDTGCAIGAGAIIRCGIELGEFCMVAAGSIVTRSVKPFHLVMGLPATESKMVCACGQTQFELNTPYSELIKDCCRENLHEDLLKIAEASAKRFARVQTKSKKVAGSKKKAVSSKAKKRRS